MESRTYALRTSLKHPSKPIAQSNTHHGPETEDHTWHAAAAAGTGAARQRRQAGRPCAAGVAAA